jgi:hypothetical protein
MAIDRSLCTVSIRVWKPADRLCRNSRFVDWEGRSAVGSELSVTGTVAAVPEDSGGRRSKRVPLSSGGAVDRFGIVVGAAPGIGSPGPMAGG